MFPLPTGQCSPVRRTVAFVSLILAVIGWIGAGVAWLVFGFRAGIHPVFLLALTVAITFTVTLAITVVTPSAARIYAIGFRDGCRQGEPDEPEEPRRLRAVR